MDNRAALGLGQEAPQMLMTIPGAPGSAMQQLPAPVTPMLPQQQQSTAQQQQQQQQSQQQQQQLMQGRVHPQMMGFVAPAGALTLQQLQQTQAQAQAQQQLLPQQQQPQQQQVQVMAPQQQQAMPSQQQQKQQAQQPTVINVVPAMPRQPLPKQLTAAIKSASNVERLTQLFNDHSALLNPIHVAAMITKLPKLEASVGVSHLTAPSSSGTPGAFGGSGAPGAPGTGAGAGADALPWLPPVVSASRALLGQLLSKIKQHDMSEYSPRGLANIVWALAKLQHYPDPELQALLLDTFVQRLPAAVPQVSIGRSACTRAARSDGVAGISGMGLQGCVPVVAGMRARGLFLCRCMPCMGPHACMRGACVHGDCKCMPCMGLRGCHAWGCRGVCMRA